MRILKLYDNFSNTLEDVGWLILDKFTNGIKNSESGMQYFFRVELPDGTSKEIELTKDIWNSHTIGDKYKK
jgi:hypothetical protein